MTIEITMKEYLEQLQLMKKQYGQEEDLYPWIYMLLKSCDNTKNLSLRNVAGANKAESVLGRELYRGYAAFPDIAILQNDFFVINIEENKLSRDDYQEILKKEYDQYSIEYKNLEDRKSKEEFIKLNEGEIKYLSKFVFNENKEKILGCVEVKKLSDSLIEFNDTDKYVSLEIECKGRIEIKPSSSYAKYWWIKEVEGIREEDDIIIKNNKNEYVKFKWNNLSKTIREFQGVKEINIKEENVISQEKLNNNEWTLANPQGFKTMNIGDVLSENSNTIAHITLEKDKPKFILDGKVIEHDDLVEVIGELLWYGKVLYTNGEIWKYIEIEKETVKQIREMFYKDYAKKAYDKWYKAIADMQHPPKGEVSLGIGVYCKTIDCTKNWDGLMELLNNIDWDANTNINKVKEIKYI